MTPEEHTGPIGQPLDPMIVMRKVVEPALHLVPSADGAVVELAGADDLTYVCASGYLKTSVGTKVRAEGSLSGLAVRTGRTLVCADSATDDRVDRVACERVGAVSMLCVPLRRGAEVVGVLKLASPRRDAFDADAVELMGGLADFISNAIAGWADLISSSREVLSTERRTTADRRRGAGPSSPGSSARERASRFVANVLPDRTADHYETRQRIEAALAAAEPTMLLQPIIDLKTDRIAGYEALARFTGTPLRSPDQWFAEAQRVGLGPDLQLAALAHALHQLPGLPEGVYLALNVGPDIAANPRLGHLLQSVDGSRLVIELTEHHQVDDYPALVDALHHIRATGARLAIDDTGAGFAGFSHILKLAPDLIKLDRILTTGIDRDPARQALAGALVNFASATRAQVIAEGIETATELATIRQLGIGYGQGYHLGRPVPPSHLPTNPTCEPPQGNLRHHPADHTPARATGNDPAQPVGGTRRSRN